MPVETVQLMVEGGKAVAGASVGQKLGPLKINIQDVMKKINDKTGLFQGMQVPVTLKIDTKTKDVSIDVGIPPTSQLIRKELGLEKGAGEPDKEKIGNISIEQCIKIAKMKMDTMYTFSLKAAVKSVAGSCNSLGVLIEGKTSGEINTDIDGGVYDKIIADEKISIEPEKKIQLQNQLEEIREKLKREAVKLKAVEEAAGVVVKKTETETKVVSEEVKVEEKKEVKEEKKKKE